MNWDYDHILHLGGETIVPDDPASETSKLRKRIEPWLSAVFQSEHLSVLLGNGFTTAIADCAGASPVTMTGGAFEGCPHQDKVDAHATAIATNSGRGTANIEDRLSAAAVLHSGLKILGSPDAATWEAAIDRVLGGFIHDVLATEKGIAAGLHVSTGAPAGSASAREILISFLMSFASRTASRDRLNIFTTNYDRLIERACDLSGVRILDRFVGAIEPEFRSSRLQIDMHYTPPGVRGEPRHLEGVVHLTKLHGSLDWRYERPRVWRTALPFGAEPAHPAVPPKPSNSVMIYPNAVKDIETAAYPYADLFRDFSASICRPNSVVVFYGYSFGDDHVNRIIADMLTIPSTHLVIIAWSEKPHDKIASFIARVGRPQQLTLLIGRHFGDIRQLVSHYLPKPAIDPLTIRMAELKERRGNTERPSGDAAPEGAL
ncbi:fibronectin-binding protein (FBP) [Roseomonas frigidaquae]|uniref:Fibronectin-binding protein (FBP) n=1 Tax=Falsiroseomonas frigidaquae TaxID=487318 RepID=A0ABX1F8U0_9PROT|nr:SIR2 family protein [Falsiroseomonas frigidaquae]NKE48629.1 fibronectin-binding protein (FBP) [Falsiroseomonas frigidaquae]